MNTNGNVAFAFTAEDELLDKVECIEDGYGTQTKAVMEVIARVANINDLDSEWNISKHVREPHVTKKYVVELTKRSFHSMPIVYIDLYCEHVWNPKSPCVLGREKDIVGPKIPKKTVLVARSYVSVNKLKRNCFIWLRDRDFGRLLMASKDQINELISPERKVTLCMDTLERSSCNQSLTTDISLFLRDFAKRYWGESTDPQYINVLFDSGVCLLTKQAIQESKSKLYFIVEDAGFVEEQEGLDTVQVNRYPQERFLISKEQVDGKDTTVIRGLYADEAKLARFESEDFLAVAVSYSDFYKNRQKGFPHATTLARLLGQKQPCPQGVYHISGQGFVF